MRTEMYVFAMVVNVSLKSSCGVKVFGSSSATKISHDGTVNLLDFFQFSLLALGKALSFAKCRNECACANELESKLM